MVFFNCNACGETLKRNKVEIHYRTKCRNCEVLSCVDCSKEFWGDDYKKHMTCISEEEKYSGSNYVAKPNKGEVKQELWQKSIADAVEKHKNNFKMKDLLTRLIEHPNIPRKQKKFENFMRSSFGVRDNKCISEIWSIISSTNSCNETTENGSTNGKSESNTEKCEPAENENHEKMAADDNVTKLSKRDKKEQRKLLCDKKEKKDRNKNNELKDDGNKKIKKKRKRKNEVSEDEDEDESSEVENKRQRGGVESEESEEEKVVKKCKIKFNWEKVIVDVLNTKGEEIPLKKLRKKVLAEYASQGGCLESEDELCAKFTKKVTKNPKFKVHKERVKLAKAR